MGVSALQVAVLNRRLRNKVTDEIIKNIKLLMYLKKWGLIKYNIGGADGVDFWVKYRDTGDGAHTIGDFTELQAETMDDFKKLTCPWAKYGRALATSKLQEKRTKNADKEDVNFNWLVNQMSSFKQQFMGVLGTDLYSDGTKSTSRGDVTTPVVGLDGILDDANTLYGEDRSQTAGAYLRSNVATITDFFGDDNLNDEVNGLEQMKTSWNNASKGAAQGDNINEDIPSNREEPDLTICDQTSYEMYANSLSARMRFTSEGADATYNTLTFERKPIDWDTYCGIVAGSAAQRMYMIVKSQVEVDCVEDNQLLSVYAEDDTGMIKKVSIATQLLALYRKPAAGAKIKITG